MKTIETFIFVHDQEIILDFLEKKKFSNFKSLKYVLVGNNPFNKVENMENVIIARKYDNNIENYPKLTSFTGWYLLWKNNLVNSEYVNLFEYDIICVDQFEKINSDSVNKNYDFIGYFPMSVSDPVYVQMRQYSDFLVSSIKKNTNVDVYKIVDEKFKENFFTTWSSSSNSTWKTEVWEDYMSWFENFLDDIKEGEYCGHMHERSLSFFYFINNLKVHEIPNIMSHFQLNTHGTSPLPKERFDQLYNKLF
jgi:hypothetical protein